jgi:hypothetical protein
MRRNFRIDAAGRDNFALRLSLDVEHGKHSTDLRGS